MHLNTRLGHVARCTLFAALPILLLCHPGLTQSPLEERSFPTQNNPKVVISNAFTLLIETWDKNEVSVRAEAQAEIIQTEEVTIKPGKNKVEIVCHPAKPGRKIILTLRVPPKAELKAETNGNTVELKEPAGQIAITNVSKFFVQMDVPPTAALDLTMAPNAVARRQVAQGAVATMGVGGRRTGTGPPFVKVTATAQIDFTLGAIETRKKPVTMAAQTIARRGGLMGEALQRSNPQLIRPQQEQNPPSNRTGAPAGRDEGALKLETHLVNLNVSAADRSGKAVPGLKAEDFTVYEDGVPQRISFFSPEQSPFNLVLLLDLSGSMRDEIELIKQTALHFLDVIGSQDSVAVVTFTTDVTVVSWLTKDRDDLRESIEWMLAPLGGTAFYDALGYTLVEVLRKVRGQRNAVIAISDGEDNALQPVLMNRPGLVTAGVSPGSFLTFDDLLEGSKESDALIYPIHLNPAAPQAAIQSSANSAGNASVRLRNDPAARMLEIQAAMTETATKQLHSLADASGARFYHADRIEDLNGVFELVAAELRTVYSMAYTPTNTNFDGRFRRIQVKTNRPDIVIRTRPGYYGR